ncbi:MAG: AI-2E family transporter, partial [Anaerolineales bacterium]|nr:AI-2E family transporter [Anaerolineales bacterium]
MKRLMRHTAVVLGTLLLLILLWQFRLIVLLFALSLFVAAAIRPFVEVLGRRGLSETLAQVLLYVVGLGGLLLLLVLLGDLLLLELNDAANRAVLAYESLHRQWQAGSMWQQTLVEGLPPPLSFAGEDGAEIAEMLPVVVTATRGLAGAIGGLLLLLALSVYWSVDQYRFERLWLSLLPATRRAYMRDSWRRIETAVGAHLRSQAAQSVLVGLFLGVGALVVGATFPLLLAFFGALAALVPLFGGVAAALFAFGVGSVAGVWVGV